MLQYVYMSAHVFHVLSVFLGYVNTGAFLGRPGSTVGDTLTFFPFRPGLPSSPAFPCGNGALVRSGGSGSSRKRLKVWYERLDPPVLQEGQGGHALLGGLEAPGTKNHCWD